MAQVSTAVITSTGTSDAGDTASITVGGTVFTTAAGIMTEDGIGAALAALIDADPAYVAAYNATNNTITVTAAVAGTAFAAPSAITITNAGGGTVDTISAVYATPTANGAAAAAGSLALTHMANDGTLELTGAGAGVTVTMTDATGAADSLNVKITNAASINVGTVAAAGVETLKVQLDDTDTTASAITAVHTLNISDAALKSLVLTGDAGGIVTHNSNVVTSIDGSALTLSLTAGSLTTATAAATITGGAGNDILTANHTGDVLIGGAGSDTLKLGGASNAGTPVYANGVTLTGGAGNDIFDISGAGSVVATVNDYATITDFSKGDVLKLEAGNLKFVAAGVATGSTAVFQDLVNKFIKESAFHDAGWFQYQGDTYVVEHLSGAVTAFVNGTDNIVKITGLVDLSNVGSYSDTGNTLLIFA
ncbi:hypothetical protein ACHMW6_29240 [Pseudoduganella sp. UC29_106]|uniref:hypothetical protein n=1 Tax=Pseudoduganella sp. UC29_106 TaxID=3374553 RepID=UPI0037566F4C